MNRIGPSGKLYIVTVKRSQSEVGRGGGQMVRVFAFNPNDPSSNPAEAYSLFL